MDNAEKYVEAPNRVMPILLPLTSLIDFISGFDQPSMVRTGRGDAMAIKSLPLIRGPFPTMGASSWATPRSMSTAGRLALPCAGLTMRHRHFCAIRKAVR